MRKYLTSLFLVLYLPLYGQIQIGSNEIATLNHAGKISKAQLAKFKRSTTVFTLQTKDYEQKELFREAIESVWKVTPFKIVEYDDLKQYEKSGYAIFSFEGYSVHPKVVEMSMMGMQLSYNLWLPEFNGRGKATPGLLARILLYPDSRHIMKDIGISNIPFRRFSDEIISYVYNEARLHNWNPGFLKGYLKEVNDRLMKGDERGPFTNYKNKEELASLKRDTLYIPEYTFIFFNKFNAREEAERPDMEKLKNAYPFPFRVVSTDELDHLILSGRSVKYLVYTRSSTDKFINVFDGKSGQLLYSDYQSVSYNFKEKDLKPLAKAIQ